MLFVDRERLAVEICDKPRVAFEAHLVSLLSHVELREPGRDRLEVHDVGVAGEKAFVRNPVGCAVALDPALDVRPSVKRGSIENQGLVTESTCNAIPVVFVAYLVPKDFGLKRVEAVAVRRES